MKSAAFSFPKTSRIGSRFESWKKIDKSNVLQNDRELPKKIDKSIVLQNDRELPKKIEGNAWQTKPR